jgi:SagB-type dehydrogenase family enzyme
MAEQRAAGDIEIGSGTGAIVFVLTSVAWREAWKYRDRAYRYCLHDIGHAWQALALSARAAGYDSFAIGHFPDDEITRSCKLAEDELPMLVVEIRGIATGSELRGGATEWFGGLPNRLSSQQVAYPLIQEMHDATSLNSGDHISEAELTGAEPDDRVVNVVLPSPAASKRAFGEAARARRSALDFRGGTESISLAQLSAILSAATQPLSADFAMTRFVRLYLYAHRVDGLQPGVYKYWPEHAGLEQIKSGDQRVAAAGLSLGQDLAGNACVAFSMIGDLGRAAHLHGNRGYRYVHFEAGAIGQRLYLAAEALGLGATGIGAFFDDAVQRYLGLTSGQGQVVYHFAIGYPIPDPRVMA